MDITLAALAALALASAHAPPAGPPAGPVVPAPRIAVPARPAVPPVRVAGAPRASPADTLIEYSSAYYTRLTIHRWGSYAMLPLFAAQYYAGTRLIDGGEDDWAENAHPMLAAGVGVLFASNTVTGLWNLWDGRRDPNERVRRVTHAMLMLIADAGFVATGLLGDESEDEPGGADTHRAVAIGSMAVSTVGWLMMTDLFRKE